MACYHPIRAYQGSGGVFFSDLARNGETKQIELPCGQCIGCRLERSRQWAVRISHEASLYKHNCFVTLTYDDLHLPSDQSLQYGDFQKFMRRLRKYVRRPKSGGIVSMPGGVSGISGCGVRFFMCGEYGPSTLRPHYHVCLFNVRFTDLKYFKCSEAGSRVYTSAVLDKLWALGHCTVGELNFESAGYTARYCVDKLSVYNPSERFACVDILTGELTERVSEFCHMSLKPGIGARWYDRFKTDVYPNGEVVVSGRLCRAPRYYDKRFARDDPAAFIDLAERRELLGYGRRSDNTYERLDVRERVQFARLRSLKRGN